MTQTIKFRCDASFEIGTGHVMRCLTLADELRQFNCDISFICRELPGNLCSYIEKRGFCVHRLPYNETRYVYAKSNLRHEHWLGVHWETDSQQTISNLKKDRTIDWLIIDHYAIDKKWEVKLRSFVKNIMVIDDLADRIHDCDVLLDQNFYSDLKSRYDHLVPAHCEKFLGPKFALLRSQFREARKTLRIRNGIVQRILIFLGGSDPTNETEKVLSAISILNCERLIVDVVVGESNSNKEKIKNLCLLRPYTNFYCQVENMAQLLVQADLAIGSGGTSTWERCYLGLPTLTVTVAQNQVEMIKALDREGIIKNIGWYEQVDVSDYLYAIKHTLNHPNHLKEMSVKSLNLCSNQESTLYHSIIKSIVI